MSRSKRKASQCGLAVVMLLALLMGIAMAQPPRGPGRGPGPRGFGGFGPPGANLARLVDLAAMPEVQKELAITTDQRQLLEAMQEEVRTTTQALFASAAPVEGEEVSPEERERQFAVLREKIDAANESTEASLKKMLTLEQAARLDQLRLQREGTAALLRDDITGKLVLTAEQKEKLQALQPQRGFGPPRFEPGAMRSALAVLTSEQQALWSKLVGPEFKFPLFGGPMRAERKLVKEFDQDGNGWLNVEERKLARKAPVPPRGGPGGPFAPFGGPGGPRGRGRGPGGPFGGGPFGASEPGTPGARIAPGDVEPVSGSALYDGNAFRTLFLEFENDDWEAELADFHGTDVDVPAMLIVDGEKYPNVGVHFRGASSYMMVGSGSKRSLNLSLDLVDSKQRLLGYKTLNLLNSNGDPSMLHAVLCSHISRQYIPAPKVNLVRVVINGENWGVYANAQQFDKQFLKENFADSDGTRWKVPGSPAGGGGLDYLGDKVADYERRYEIKTKDNHQAWMDLIKLCRTLQETPLDQLESALEPMLDIESTLWFLALDNALINNDGYWVRASDFNIYRDTNGKFYLIPHDMNETFQAAMGRGGPGRGRRPGGPALAGGPDGTQSDGAMVENRFSLDPLVGMDDTSKPLRSRLLAVPALQQRYLKHVRMIAEKSLDWEQLGPVVQQYRTLIEPHVEADTRKLASFAAFQDAVSVKPTVDGGGERSASIHTFVEQRRQYLLEHPEIKKLQRSD